MVEYGKIPPQATEVERAVLGALLLERDSFNDIRAIISSKSFYDERNAKIFEIIERRHKENKPIDLMVCTRDIQEAGIMEQVGGVLYLTKLVNLVATAGNIEHHARIIAEKAAKREMIRITSQLLNDSYDDSNDIDFLIEKFNDGIKLVDDLFVITDTGTHQREVCKNTLEEIYKGVEQIEKGETVGISTGFNELNRATGGWRETNFIILAARPGVGKTSLALHFAKTAAQKGLWVNFFSYEMTDTQLEKILIASECKVDRTNIRDSKLTKSDLKEIEKSVGIIENLPILWNTKRFNVEQIEQIVRQNKKAGRCDLVIVDYIQLVRPSEIKSSREQQVSHISSTMKQIGLNYKIPIIGLSQLNRSIESRADKKPTLSDLRESGSLEQDADIVLFPFRNEDDQYFISIGKNRNGVLGDIDIWANDQMTKFGDSEIIEDYNFIPDMNAGFETNEEPF